jgi:exodeoxyribonuclease-3
VRLATVNVNGIRAAINKNRGQEFGFADWIAERDCDIVTLQEVRAPDHLFGPLMAGFGYHSAHTEAVDKGRAGVAVLSRTPLSAVRIGNGAAEFDDSGRWIEVDIPLGSQTLTVISAYVHSGEAGTGRQLEKYRFLDAMLTRIAEIDNPAVLTGDLNIGHGERDIRNWKGNRNKAGFLPQERAYLDRLIGEFGWVDVHRALAGEVDGPYTWWSMRGQAFDNDTGWRIDYQFATGDLAARARAAAVDRAPSWAARWSDHAPLVIDYDI